MPSRLSEEDDTDESNLRQLQQRVRSLEDMLYSLAGADRWISPDLRSDRFNQARQGIILATEMVPKKAEITEALKWVKDEREEDQDRREAVKWVSDQRDTEKQRKASVWSAIRATAIGVTGAVAGALASRYLGPVK